MHPVVWALLMTTLVFLGTLLALEGGFRLGRREFRRSSQSHEGVGAVEASAFALFGLLLGLSFAAAGGRLENKRQIVIDEGNAMGTAYLRVDLLPAAAQPAIREQYKRMIDARLQAHADRADPALMEQSFQTFAAAQTEIWNLSVAALAGEPRDTRQVLVLDPINTMLDVGTTRRILLDTRLPGLIVALLVGAALMSAVLAGYAMSKRGTRSLTHLGIFALMIAATIYVVIDLDHPRFGLIRMESAYEGIVELRDSMR